MGLISLQIPQAGLPNSTEDAKVATDLTVIQTAINGNLDDSNLLSPNNGVRRLLLQTSGTMTGLAQNTYWFSAGNAIVLAQTAAIGPDIWFGDSGLSSQPQDYQVANKTAYARVRATAITNAVSIGQTFGVGLYQIISLSGSGSVGVSATPVVGTSFNVVSSPPAANAAFGGEGPQFALPVSAGAYILCAFTNGQMAANSTVALTMQLLAYNA